MKAKKTTFNRLAEEELAEAVLRYEREAPGQGRRLYEEVQQGLSFLERHPEAAPRVRGDIRRLFLPKFPYSLMYRFSEGRLRILAVAHHRRQPDYWVGRR